MQINSTAIKIILFCATLIGGILVFNLLSLSSEKTISNEVKEDTSLKPSVEFIQPKFEDYSAEPPCKRHLGNQSKYTIILREEEKIIKSLFDKTKSSQNRNLSRQKLNLLKREIQTLEEKREKLNIAKSFEEFQEQLGSVQKSIPNVHTLRYVENCTEY